MLLHMEPHPLPDLQLSWKWKLLPVSDHGLALSPDPPPPHLTFYHLLYHKQQKGDEAVSEAVSKTVAYTIGCLGTFLWWRDLQHFCLHTEWCCQCQRDRAGGSSLEYHHSGRMSPVELIKGILQSNAAYIMIRSLSQYSKLSVASQLVPA